MSADEFKLGETLLKVKPEQARAMLDELLEGRETEIPTNLALLETLTALLIFTALGSGGPDAQIAALGVPRKLLEHAAQAVASKAHPLKRDAVTAADIVPAAPTSSPELSQQILGLVAHLCDEEDGKNDPKDVIRVLVNAIVYATWFHTMDARQSLALIRDVFDAQIAHVPPSLRGPVS
jgi:hypothetical protein